MRIIALCVVAFAVSISGQTRPTTAPAVAEKLSTTEHELKVGEQSLKYKATAGTMPLKDEAGKPRASFFFVAYEKRETDAKRPITFVFNGGPGAAAIWLHLGTAGPKRIALDKEGYPGPPPYRLLDNPTTWLNTTDLVFIDPVGTGFSRPAEGAKGEEFYGVQQDIETVSEFIRLYLVKGQRWNSPKFIAGESYGTTRCAMLAEHLHDRYGISLNGVALISMVLNFQTLSASAGNELPYALFFPTYTSAALYHKRLGAELSADPEKTRNEAEKWVVETYAPALMKGDSLTAEERKQIIATMAKYSGLSEAYIAKNDLKVSPSEFQKELLAEQRKVIGRFDSRIAGPSSDPTENHAEYDPSLSRYVGVYSESFNQYIRSELKFESDLPYEFLSGRVHPWNWGRSANSGWLYVADNLKRAMVKNPNLKVLVASGHHDLATPYFAADYTINHLGVPAELRNNIRQTYYEAGHMMYHHQADLEKLNRDMNEFIREAVK